MSAAERGAQYLDALASGRRVDAMRAANFRATSFYRADQEHSAAIKSCTRADDAFAEKHGAREAEARRKLAALRPKHLPAFGRAILDLRKRGLVPVHVVYVMCDCWQWKYADRPRVVIAYKDEPYEIDFSILAGLCVIIVWSPMFTRFPRIDAIIREIVKVRPSFLHVMNMMHDNDFTVVNVKGELQIPEYAA